MSAERKELSDVPVGNGFMDVKAQRIIFNIVVVCSCNKYYFF